VRATFLTEGRGRLRVKRGMADRAATERRADCILIYGLLSAALSVVVSRGLWQLKSCDGCDCTLWPQEAIRLRGWAQAATDFQTIMPIALRKWPFLASATGRSKSQRRVESGRRCLAAQRGARQSFVAQRCCSDSAGERTSGQNDVPCHFSCMCGEQIFLSLQCCPRRSDHAIECFVQSAVCQNFHSEDSLHASATTDVANAGLAQSHTYFNQQSLTVYITTACLDSTGK
jgi:hypothetical protein